MNCKFCKTDRKEKIKQKTQTEQNKTKGQSHGHLVEKLSEDWIYAK